MKVIRQKITIMCLISVLVLGAATNGAASAVSCAPKVRCCTTAGPKDLHHDGNGLMRLTHNCAPMTSVPCCNFKAVQPKTALATSPRPKISTNHAVILLQPSNGIVPLAQHFATRIPILEDERIRAPLVPIYLLTLTILC